MSRTTSLLFVSSLTVSTPTETSSGRVSSSLAGRPTSHATAELVQQDAEVLAGLGIGRLQVQHVPQRPLRGVPVFSFLQQRMAEEDARPHLVRILLRGLRQGPARRREL